MIITVYYHLAVVFIVVTTNKFKPNPPEKLDGALNIPKHTIIPIVNKAAGKPNLSG